MNLTGDVKMKSLRRMLSAVLMSLATVALAQSDAQQSFDKLKTLAGSWEGQVTTTPQDAAMDGKLQVSFRVTSRGNALMHEMTGAGSADDPITMLYMDQDRLLLTHYCDAGNRPRMTGKMSADGKTVEFQFLDVAGSTQYGHMHHAVITFLDANHHTEDWTFLLKGDKLVHAHFDLQRTK
ncbi:MAG TPA: hypothetical protein VNW97_15355 [Candidatus Saccharimonadales bacterium]|nr:hypothetical protein [Candidatus Saccharimonadales bacterium]